MLASTSLEYMIISVSIVNTAVIWIALVDQSLFISSVFLAKAQEMKAMAEQGLNAAKDKCKVQ